MRKKRLQKRKKRVISEAREPRVSPEYRPLVDLTKFANLIPTTDAPRVEAMLNQISAMLTKMREIMVEVARDDGASRQFVNIADDLATKRNDLLAPLWASAHAQFPSSNDPKEVLVRLGNVEHRFHPPEEIGEPDLLAEAVLACRLLFNALIGGRHGKWNYVEVPASPVRVELHREKVGEEDLLTMRDKSDNFVNDMVLPALRGRNALRLGFCPRKRCGRYFVRGRKDQRGCTPRCAVALRQHKAKPFEAIENDPNREPSFFAEVKS